MVLSSPDRQRQLPGIAAVIDGAQITVGQLAEECIVRHGQEVLEGLIGRKLIDQACQQQHITVSERDLDAEVVRVASIMLRSLPDGSPDVQGFLKMVAEKQGLSADIYRRDSVWPTVALKKLVRRQDQDHRGGHAKRLRGQLRAASAVPGDRAGPTPPGPAGLEIGPQTAHARTFRRTGGGVFHRGHEPRLAGEVPPIAKHSGQPELEKEAFALKPGEMSGIIQLGDHYVIIFCEGYTKPEKVEPAKVRDLIYEDLHEKKERLEMADYFAHLQDRATIDNFLAGKIHSPAKPESLGPSDLRLPTLREVPRPGNG